MTQITIPDFALVVLIGASGSGKSTFARSHFKPTEVISSDFCRGLVADDENDQRPPRRAGDGKRGGRPSHGRVIWGRAARAKSRGNSHDGSAAPAASGLGLTGRSGNGTVGR